MKIQDLWKENLANEGINFDYTPSGGKYPYVATISFSSGNKISMRGKKSKDVLYLISCDRSDIKSCSEEELKHFSFILDFFTAFAKEKGAKSILLYKEPFEFVPIYIRDLILPDDKYLYLESENVQFFRQKDILHVNTNGWVRKLAECPISLYFEADAIITSFLKNKTKTENSFSLLENRYGRKMNVYKFHFYGYDGHFVSSVQESDVVIKEENLNLTIHSSVNDLKDSIGLLFEKMRNSLKVKSIFSKSTHFLDRYINELSPPYSLRETVKKLLLETHSHHHVEEMCANDLKKNKKVIHNERDFSFFIVADDVFVTDYNRILFHGKVSEKVKAFEVFEKSIISQLEKELIGKKNKLEKLKKTI